MLGLTIHNLKIMVQTPGGDFSAYIPFEKGLNVIRAENSSGKSTCVNAIPYALGLEAILGPRKNPFAQSLYHAIYTEKTDNPTPFFVSKSSVELEISNQHGVRANIQRDVKGNDSKISVASTHKAGEYFLGAGGGGVGSAISDRGFHNWLADFLGWKLPTVSTFEGREVPLYLECIFPLFFIEQKRGWSEIQANTPTQYGIRNVKKAAAEFCLGLNTFEHEKKINELLTKKSKLENDWDHLKQQISGLADVHELIATQLPEIDQPLLSTRIGFQFVENDAQISLEEEERSLERLVVGLIGELFPHTPRSAKIEESVSRINNLADQLEEVTRKLDLTLIAIRETESKLATLSSDLDQYHQLRKLRNVGASVDTDTSRCPICESELYDTLGPQTLKRQPMSLDENIEFLKNQIDFYTSIKKKNERDYQQYKQRQNATNSSMKLAEKVLESLREDMRNVNGDLQEKIRQKVQAEEKLTFVRKLKSTQETFSQQASHIHTSWLTATESLRLARKSAPQIEKSDVINDLQALVKSNLHSFKFNTSILDSISISKHNLRPEQDGFDIVADTSASDHIRIIWAYTLALLQIAKEHDEVNHSGFVVFDEPRQHEASKNSFLSLIDKAAQTMTFGGQVIFATSMDLADLKVACEGKGIKLSSFDDYILQLTPTEVLDGQIAISDESSSGIATAPPRSPLADDGDESESR